MMVTNMLKHCTKLIHLYCLIFISSCLAFDQNNIEEELLKAMKAYNVPVVGYAIIDNYKVVAAKTISIDPNIQVSKSSLFQAASISKSMSAYAALSLVADHKLDLDKDLNQKLTSWKIPINEFNKENPVTLRHILNMTSGLSVSGFAGHAFGEALPTLKDVLDGKPPANSAPIRVFYTPGSRYYYSGGSFEVLEQVIEDMLEQPFNQFMNSKILPALNMKDSIFQYPLNEESAKKAIPGFWADGKELKGGWNNYAISASGGMWSTPEDIAQFAINVSKSYLGREEGLIPKILAKEMLTRQKNTDYGLGFVINGQDRTLNFRKAGHNFGYHSEVLMFPNSGQGVVIMTNSENGDSIKNFIIPIIAHEYHWPCYFPFFDELVEIPEYAC